MVDQTVLIVGVASFQGFHLARRLLQEGFDVVGIDDEGRHKTRIAKQRLYVLTHPQFQLIRTTLANKTVMRSILKRHEPSHIILCSTRTVDDPLERYELMKRYIALHTTRVSLESFITFDLPVKEVSEEDPAIHLFTEDVFGPWDDASTLVSKAIVAVDRGVRLSGYYATDIINVSYIDDVVESVVRLLRLVQTGLSPVGYFQIPASDYVTVQTLLSDIGHILNKSAKTSLPMRTSVLRQSNIPTLDTLVGFSPSTSLFEGLEQVVDWYISYKNMMKEGIK
ncbi:MULTISPECIES: NAD-dependent epimerase/dehydratase family protein [unclassified Exiguobacterium]|uniref:NAD-dependent epimerase/dehydratase family protein n=1 Tax=unclassified Exiguobacterium TaxID=2644629 RepID=UPI001038DA05|nr:MULTISPECIES: NAD-dependent epimerase/dehydratase family protein [unclassified Exiguobacterium]TCI71433.1 NAD-dependent epimerase/dehydratase family protein [Exiguobacterium sp. IPCI3]TCI81411.1 NAD-dependent epimerase/dehydratase family protein [Exiguobacterium sp. IPCH1]TCI82608.1 NAD-dependent epimerase/dehydratase family protein [Exiguobacterium sp. IPBC4]